MDFEQILDLSIPFPTIDGKSDRQVHYAEQLREAYIIQHEQRFREIDEQMQIENDMLAKMLNAYDAAEHFTSYDMEYTEAERACLFGIDAGGIIATLKKEMDR